MLVRQVVIPASPEKLWATLTEPEAVSGWFGFRVEWDLRPGGPARFSDDDGTVRHGIVDAVRPGRHLSFRWWPEDEDHGAASQVSYDLEADEDGTRLTVTEQQLPEGEPRRPVAKPSQPVAEPSRPVAELSRPVTCDGAVVGVRPTPSPWPSWTEWDTRLFGCWARSTASVLVGRAAR